MACPGACPAGHAWWPKGQVGRRASILPAQPVLAHFLLARKPRGALPGRPLPRSGRVRAPVGAADLHAPRRLWLCGAASRPLARPGPTHRDRLAKRWRAAASNGPRLASNFVYTWPHGFVTPHLTQTTLPHTPSRPLRLFPFSPTHKTDNRHTVHNTSHHIPSLEPAPYHSPAAFELSLPRPPHPRAPLQEARTRLLHIIHPHIPHTQTPHQPLNRPRLASRTSLPPSAAYLLLLPRLQT